MKNFLKRYQPGHPLYGYPGPDPATVAVCMPIADFKPDIACMLGLMQCMPFFAKPIFYAGNSLVNQARNTIAHQFLNLPEHAQFEWSVWIDSDIGFTPQDWCYLMEGNDPLVTGPYSKKTLEGIRVETGFGFVRVHRKVFNAIRDLLDDEGKERASRFYWKGDLCVDYFPTGPSGNGQWLGEDDGFFSWAAIAGYNRRIEERVDLTHYGRHGFKLPRRQAE